MAPVFKLNPDPTFDVTVPVPVPGNGFVDITFKVVYRKRKDLSEFFESIKEKTDEQVFLETVKGWNIDYEFNEENAKIFVENYFGATAAIIGAYSEELMKVREKN